MITSQFIPISYNKTTKPAFGTVGYAYGVRKILMDLAQDENKFGIHKKIYNAMIPLCAKQAKDWDNKFKLNKFGVDENSKKLTMEFVHIDYVRDRVNLKKIVFEPESLSRNRFLKRLNHGINQLKDKETLNIEV